MEGLPREFLIFSPCLKLRDSLKNPQGDSLGTPRGVLSFWGFTGENKGESLGTHQGLRIF